MIFYVLDCRLCFPVVHLGERFVGRIFTVTVLAT